MFRSTPQATPRPILDHPLPHTFLIFSTQRSGSTMICGDLSATGLVGKPNEYFVSLVNRYTDADVSLSVDELRSLLEQALIRGEKQPGIASYNLMSNHLSHIGRALLNGYWTKGFAKPAWVDFYQDACYRFFREQSQQLTCLRIYRQDKVKQAISRLLAKTTGLYHKQKTASGTGETRTVTFQGKHFVDEPFEIERHYSHGKLNQLLIEILDEERALDRFLHRNRIPTVVINYETSLKDRHYLKALAPYLDVNADELPPVHRELQKLSNQLNQEIYERFWQEGGPQTAYRLLQTPQQVFHLLRRQDLWEMGLLPQAIATWLSSGFQWPSVDFSTAVSASKEA